MAEQKVQTAPVSFRIQSSKKLNETFFKVKVFSIGFDEIY